LFIFYQNMTKENGEKETMTRQKKYLRPCIKAIFAVLLIWACVGSIDVLAQARGLLDGMNQELVSEGWSGFLDFPFLLTSVLSLLLSTVLGAAIAYHPKSRRTMESIEDLETPKIFIMYAVVGAVIGVIVLEYGEAMGLVVFGIGGLMRFRSNLGSPTKTGRVIFVTLIGLCSGLNMPHIAVLTTVFGFALIYVLDARVTYKIMVKGLRKDAVQDAAEIYRSVMEQQGCRILSEKKDFMKMQVAFVFRTSYRVERDDLEHLFEIDVPEDIKGAVDWQTG